MGAACDGGPLSPRGGAIQKERTVFQIVRGPAESRSRAAGVLRLALALHKCGVESGAGLRAEKSRETIVLRVRGLADDVETAARLAAGKHLLEEYLGLPLVLKPAAKPGKVVTLTPNAKSYYKRGTATKERAKVIEISQ